MIIEREKQEKEIQIPEKEMQMREKESHLQKEIRERELEAHIFIEKEKLKHFYVTKHTRIRVVPPFNENEVDNYFFLFEKVANDLDWPLNKSTILLQSVLKGKASEVYLVLKPEQTSDYQTVTETILKAYELVPEAHRQKFRNFKKEPDKTHVEFARDKERLFDRWCMSEKNGTNFNNLKEMIFLKNSKIVFIHPLKIILPKIKLKLCIKHQKWLMSSFSLTSIFFRSVHKVLLLKETFTMRKILLVLIILHQM